MCLCDTSAKIVKGFYENNARLLSKKYPLTFQPRDYFCENFLNGTAKKKYKVVLDIIFCIIDYIDFNRSLALALADAGDALCVYFFCIGNGYYLIVDKMIFQFFTDEVSKIIAGVCRLFYSCLLFLI